MRVAEKRQLEAVVEVLVLMSQFAAELADEKPFGTVAKVCEQVLRLLAAWAAEGLLEAVVVEVLGWRLV